jgi:hypothetical protein
MSMDKNPQTESLEQALSRITERELSLNERYGHLVLAMVAATFGAGALAMLATMPGLNWRFTMAFVVMLVVSLAWVVGFGIAFVRRPPLLVDREIAVGRVSVAFAVLFTLSQVAIRFILEAPFRTPWAGLLLTSIAVALLLRAHLRRSSLRALRARLEAELAAAS